MSSDDPRHQETLAALRQISRQLDQVLLILRPVGVADVPPQAPDAAGQELGSIMGLPPGGFEPAGRWWECDRCGSPCLEGPVHDCPQASYSRWPDP